MRLPTKSLIAKIEALSAQMTPEQLKDFLDVLDSMAVMVEDAKAMPAFGKPQEIDAIKLLVH